EFYDYYTMVEPFAGGYYAIGEKEKARKILDQLMTKYKENLKFYSNMKSSEQGAIGIDIVTDIERFRSLLQVMKDRGDVEFYNKNRPVFNNYNKLFERFGRDKE
ncbi:MAG: hypothetical protein ABWZ56_08455, partial [Flavobacterium sp.]